MAGSKRELFAVRNLLLGLTCLLVVAPSAVGGQVLPLDQAARQFGARPTTRSADLSPDGNQIIYMAAGPNSVTTAHLLDVPSGRSKLLARSTGKPEGLSRCDFAAVSWAVCGFGGNFHYDRIIIGMSRTIAVDLRTGEFKPMSVREDPDSVRLNQFDGRVIDWLPGENGAVLMQRNYTTDLRGMGVDRVQFEPFKIRRVETPTPRADYYLTDGHGTVRFVGEAVTSVGESLTGDMKYRYRLAGSRDWRPLAAKGEDFTPILVERASNSLYYLDKLDGRFAMFRLSLDGTEKSLLVAKHGSVDIDGPIVLAPGEPVIGYRYTDDRSRTVFSDPAFAKLNAALGRALPKAPLIEFVGASKDRDKLLVFASGDTDPGAYYVLDRKTMELNSILEARETLAGVSLSPSKHVEIRMRDGKSIPAYVTMSGNGPAKGRPTIIMPHGGPSSRDQWGFDWLAQFLAARGYAVIQPNFRGSSGYGEDFLGENAFKGWRLAMNDIADAAEWAASQGLADRGRMAILGWSYGGYAALQSAALDPRYKAVVAIAPVTDLGALRRDAEGFTDADIAKDLIGKGPHLREGSPVQRAASIKAPVLLVHGDLDSNVRVAHSQRMERALRKSGGSVELLKFDKLDHYLDDSDARTQMLTRIGQLLDRTIGQPAK